MEKKISIKYFYNFKEDNRKSMRMISDYLYQNLKKDSNFKISKFIPKFSINYLSFFGRIWNLRYNRYIHYPNLVKKTNKSDIAHIIDHQYAHLVDQIQASYKIITVHDLIPIVFKKQIGKNPYLVKHSLSYLKKFNKVIAVSKNTKKDILKYTDCPKQKIVVLKSSVENTFNIKKINKKLVCIKYKIPFQSKKILIVGNSFYKNHKISLKILEEVKKTHKNLIFIKIGNKFDFNIKKKLKKSIIQLSNIKRDEVNKIYKISDVLLFPSLYEGYGLPVLEAMKTGLPIIASNKESIKEILGRYPLLFNPNDVKKMSKSIVKLIENKNYNTQIKKYLKKRSIFFKEDNYFQQLKKIYLN